MLDGLRLAVRQWWLLLLIPVGLTSWIAFLYVGLRVRRPRWIAFGAFYLFVAYLVLEGHDAHSSLDPDKLLEAVTWTATVGLWFGSAAHGLAIRRRFLHLVEVRKDPASAGTFERRDPREWGDGIATWTWPALMVFLLGFGTYVTWESLSELPRTYDTLERRGVVTQARPAYHRVGITGDDDYYSLTLTFRGETISKRYEHNYAQFESLPADAVVPVMVDPQDTDTVFTVTDVRARTNSGIGFLALFGIGLVLASCYGLVWFIRFERRSRRELEAVGRGW